ncbi:DEAD/DEAH box helicase family protein [Streptomyces sp. NPDC059037]|uniref:DEAD/DEAH box helicase n=1 Tax=Streptomyces sp. NPDC059037 TaxID=3346710 RepID=UPI0036C44620
MPHQRSGCEAVVRALEAPAGGGEGGLRAQVRMACGTGKTRLAAEVANRVAAGGRVLVVEPTLELVKQSLVAFRRDGGRRGAMAAVCSLGSGDEVLALHDVSATTSPAQLAWWWERLVRRGHRAWTVFTTYASIPAIAEAHALDVAGIPALPAWDLVITDEAHRSAGTTTWALVNEQGAVPAVRRLALTATPRIWSALPHGTGHGISTGVEELARSGEHEEVGADEGLKVFGSGRAGEGDGEVRQGVEGPAAGRGGWEGGVRVPVVGGERPLASMDNPAWFGPVAFELTLQQAQAAGLVARFQIVVAEVDDPVLQGAVAAEGRSGERVRGLYLAAQQAAVLKAARAYGLRRVLAYANRVEDAEAFAVTLAGQARRLRGAGVRVPRRVWGAALSAKNTPAQRRSVLQRQFAAGRDSEGKAVDLGVVASVRLFSEGLDVPAVDGVAFIEPRQGAIDLVQCVGRALRIPPEQRVAAQCAGALAGRVEKVATIVVPVVHLKPGSGGDLYGPAWDGVVALLRALRAHSETLVDQLVSPRTAHRPWVAESLAGGSRRDRAGVDGGAGAGVSGGLLEFLLGERDAGDIAQWVQLCVRESLADDQARALAAARHFRERAGHLKVPRDHREGDVLLGVQIESWRKAYRGGRLEAVVAGQLEELGIEWAPREDAWQAAWRAIEAYALRYRHLLPRRDEAITVEGIVHGIGRIMTDCRREAFSRRWPDRVRELDGVRVGGQVVPWRVEGPWNAAWQRHLTLVDLYVSDGGDVCELLGGARLYGGEDLGRWVCGQLARWGTLGPEHRAELVGRGVGVSPAGAGSGIEVAGTGQLQGLGAGSGQGGRAPSGVGGRRRSRGERFRLVVAAARYHLDHVGPLVGERNQHIVDPAFSVSIDGVEIRLRQRLHTARQRRAGLDMAQLGQLAGLGLDWAREELVVREGEGGA